MGFVRTSKCLGIGLELSLRVVLVFMFKVAPLSLRVMFKPRMGGGNTTLGDSRTSTS